jgi:drug/metabolite transporter (DMT)-like permease
VKSPRPGPARPAPGPPRPGAARRPSLDTGVLAVLVLAPLWGYSWVAGKVALGYAAPLAYATVSLGLCTGCLFLVLLVTRRPLRPPPLAAAAVVGLLQTALFAFLANTALHVGGAGRVSVLTYTMPFWLLLLAWPLLGERLHGGQWPALALAFAGLVLIIGPWDGGSLAAGLLSLGAGLVWAVAALAVKLFQRRAPMDPLSLTAWQMALGVPALGVAALLAGGGIRWTGTFALCLAYSALLSNALCWVLWVYALGRLSSGVAGLGTLAIPVVGVLAAWLQLGEVPSAVEGAGMVLIVLALGLLAVQGLRAERLRRRPPLAVAPGRPGEKETASTPPDDEETAARRRAA